MDKSTAVVAFLLLYLFPISGHAQEFRIPVKSTYKWSVDEVQLTQIGAFGLLRNDRPAIKAHLHSGIDIVRPGDNYKDNPIFPIAEGIVISLRDDGPFAQIIIEHYHEHLNFWTVYEHIAGIQVAVGDIVSTDMPIARFMNKEELSRHGTQFDHFHFEVLKVPPVRLAVQADLPFRRFNSYTLTCFSEKDLTSKYYHPLEFLEELLTDLK